MATEFFSIEIPDIQSLIKDMNLMNENVNKSVREGLHEAADRILAEQKRLAPYDFAQFISKSPLYITKKGNIGIVSGYLSSNTFLWDYDDELGYIPGIVGAVYEFGRPGNSSTFRKDKYRYYSRRSKKRAEKGGHELEVFKGLKGTIQPTPHIRRGFDNVVDKAVQTVVDHINAEIDKFGDT